MSRSSSAYIRPKSSPPNPWAPCTSESTSANSVPATNPRLCHRASAAPRRHRRAFSLTVTTPKVMTFLNALMPLVCMLCSRMERRALSELSLATAAASGDGCASLAAGDHELYHILSCNSRLAQLVERVTSTVEAGDDEVSRSSRLMGTTFSLLVTITEW
ncbi:hypothetical protein FKP32DRAFT_1003371 [Trametes sanguinea]|nr:hypothetical protein FKP32DRAFT_1003371 [Trametes sanguinea]